MKKVTKKSGKKVSAKKVSAKKVSAKKVPTKKPATTKSAMALTALIEPKKLAPNFTLVDGAGVSHSLADYAGSVVILYF